MENETLDNILENQDKKITETNQLLENVLENGDTGSKKVVEAIEKLKPIMESAKSMQSFLNVIKGDKGDSIKGDKGDSIKGDKGDSIKGDKGDKGDNPTIEELKEIIEPLIPEPIKGDSIKGDKGDSIKGDKGDSIKGDKGDDGKDSDIKEIIKVLEKRKISYRDLKDVPTLYKKGAGGGTGYLREITDIEVLEDPTDGQALVYDASKKQWKAGTVGSSAGTVENLSAQCNGSATVFTTASNTGIIWLSLNGTMLIEGKEFTRDSATQITLTFAPETGEELYLKYV